MNVSICALDLHSITWSGLPLTRGEPAGKCRSPRHYEARHDAGLGPGLQRDGLVPFCASIWAGVFVLDADIDRQVHKNSRKSGERKTSHLYI